MRYLRNLVSGCLFFATISCVASKSLEDEHIWESDAKTLVTSGGSIYASINTTTLVYLMLGSFAVIALVGGLLYLATSGDALNNKSSGDYFYPDYASGANPSTAEGILEYAATEQSVNESEGYRRKRAAFEQSKFNNLPLYKSNCSKL